MKVMSKPRSLRVKQSPNYVQVRGKISVEARKRWWHKKAIVWLEEISTFLYAHLTQPKGLGPNLKKHPKKGIGPYEGGNLGSF